MGSREVTTWHRANQASRHLSATPPHLASMGLISSSKARCQVLQGLQCQAARIRLPLKAPQGELQEQVKLHHREVQRVVWAHHKEGLLFQCSLVDRKPDCVALNKSTKKKK